MHRSGMAKETLGEFEHHVLLATLRLDGAAYSAAIVTELERVTGRDVAPAAVYIALRRLEEGGLARSQMRAAAEGGRQRRYFQPTPRGLELMQESQRRFQALWNGVAFNRTSS